MPRYFGFNFWQQAIEEKRDFLSLSVLTVPQYLEQIDWYVHHGNPPKYLQDTNDFEIFEDQHDGTFTDFMKITFSENYDKLETFINARKEKIFDKHDINFIPSSNPESQRSPIDLNIENTDESSSITNISQSETFDKEMLDKLDDICDDKELLEEVLCVEGLHDIHLPQLQQLVSRLQPKLLKDPLCNKHGQLYTENNIFKNELCFETKENVDSCQKRAQRRPEDFIKIKLDIDEKLEEILSPVCYQKGDDFISTSIQDLLETSQPEIISPILNTKHIYDELILRNETPIDNLPERDEFNCQLMTKEKSFVEINEQGTGINEKSSLCLEDMFIESPLFCCDSPCYKEYITDGWKSLQCQPFAMPLLKSKKYLLRESEEVYLKKIVWQQEKYYNEDLCLHLSEPEARNKILDVEKAMLEIKSGIVVAHEARLGEAELKLSWDPFPPTGYSLSEIEKWPYKLQIVLPANTVEEFKVEMMMRIEEETQDTSKYVNDFVKHDNSSVSKPIPQQLLMTSILTPPILSSSPSLTPSLRQSKSSSTQLSSISPLRELSQSLLHSPQGQIATYPPPGQIATYPPPGQIATNPLQEQIATNPLQEQIATNPLQEQIATNPLQEQIAANPLQEQIATNPPKRQTATNPLQEQKGTKPPQRQTATYPPQAQMAPIPMQEQTALNPQHGLPAQGPSREWLPLFLQPSNSSLNLSGHSSSDTQGQHFTAQASLVSPLGQTSTSQTSTSLDPLSHGVATSMNQSHIQPIINAPTTSSIIPKMLVTGTSAHGRKKSQFIPLKSCMSPSSPVIDNNLITIETQSKPYIVPSSSSVTHSVTGSTLMSFTKYDRKPLMSYTSSALPSSSIIPYQLTAAPTIPTTILPSANLSSIINENDNTLCVLSPSLHHGDNVSSERLSNYTTNHTSTDNGLLENITMETTDSLELFLSMQDFKLLEDKSEVKRKSGCNIKVNCKPVLPDPMELNKISQQSRIVSVQFSGPFEETLKELEIYVKPYINVLKVRGDLVRSFNFNSASADSIRFFLKQKEKQLNDGNIDKEKEESYKSLLMVYCIKTAGDNLLHGCLESAISQLSLLQDNHSKMLGASLNEIRKTLFHQQYMFQKSNVIHPKILAVCREATGILQSKLSNKILLVVVKRSLMSLMSILKDCLTVEGFIKPYIIQEKDDWKNIKNGPENCFIVSQKSLKDICLTDVSYLFEYECSQDSILRSICESHSVTFIGFTVQGVQTTESSNPHGSDDNTLTTGKIPVEVYNQYRPITVIGSTHLTKHKDILQILESKYNVVVIERDYSCIPVSQVKSMSFADIILNQDQAVILQDLLELAEENNIEPITKRLALFGFKYKKCWIILFNFDNTKGYPLSSRVLSNLFKLEAALTNMTHKGQQEIAFKVLLCHQREDICCLVREICDIVCKSAPHENLERQWLTPTISKVEKMLLCLPFLNSYSIQLLLKKASIKEIITMSLEQLHRLFPELPYKVLQSCQKAFHNDNGLHLLPASQQSDEEFYIITNDLESQNAYSEFNIQESPSQRENISRLPAKQINKDVSFYKNNTSVSTIPENNEDFVVDLTSESQNSGTDGSQDKPNQFIIAEMEGRRFYKKQPHENIQTNVIIDRNTDCMEYGGRYKKNTFNLKQNIFSPKSNTQTFKYNCFSEPNLHSLEMDNVFQSHQDDSSKFCEKDPSWGSTNLLDQKTSRESNNLPKSLQSSRMYTSNQIYRKPKQSLSEKTSPSRFKCLPIECNQTVKRLQERNAINIPGITIRDKIQVYENNNNNSSSEYKLLHKAYKQSENRPFTEQNYEVRKSAKFSADLTSTTRNLLRRPVLHHTLQNNLLHPSVQRISVGLAQPVRRMQEPTVSSDIRKEVFKSVEESPPMELDYDLQQTHRNRTNMEIAGEHQSRTLYKPGCEGQLRQVNASGDDNITKNKQNKLSYRSVPGLKGGQTILTFQ